MIIYKLIVQEKGISVYCDIFKGVMFKRDKESFSKREEKVLAFWESQDIFHKSLKNRVDAEHFSFYDGPPFATGLPHYGHILAGTIKDVVARYKTMKGFSVPRRFGWDCHGLPVENEIEKTHGLSGALQIEDYGIGKFNEECRKIVLRFTSEWKRTVLRMGRWVEFDKTYHTMDRSFMESVWWVFSEIWKKGLVYEGYKVMHYSPKLGTPISNFEANLNYREVDDPSLTVKFQLEGREECLLVWTTTPWTLPSNLALAVGPKLEYVKIRERESGALYILAKSRLQAIFSEQNFDIVDSFLGEALLGKKYIPLFPYFKDHPNSFVVLQGDFIATDEGTGIVHMAPAFGEDDFYACKAAGIEGVCPIDVNCQFTLEVPDYQGLFVKDADKEIIKRLKSELKVFKHQTIRHRYPFCWRTDLPLIYRAVSTWFIAVEKIKDKIEANNQLINWVPHHIKDGRFGKWLESARDWAVSRNRYWGTPLPIWRSEDGDMIVISSVEDLEQRVGQKVEDLHRHFIDHLTFEENGKVYRRVTEVFDCWFESGSMPYAQNHFPFENAEVTMKEFPADFIAEGLDQTRGWFYTLTVIASALYDQPAFLNVIVNGIVLAEDGHKMSKRLKNYPDPELVIGKYGSDAVRLCLLNSPVVRAEDMNFSETAVEGVLKQVLLPLWNSYSFLATYAEIYEWVPTADNFDRPKADLDRWILSRLQKLIEDVTERMDRYELDAAVEPIILFVDQLTNWYIRRSRTRFWADENSEDRRQAFETLYTVILTIVKLASPMIPFLTESIYQELKREGSEESVHLTDFPKVDEYLRDIELEEEMAATQLIVNSGHALRKEHQIKVRQPLRMAHIVASEKRVLEGLERHKHLIMDELNVKDLAFQGDETAFVKLKPKANYRVLGKKVGKFMNQVREKIDQFDQNTLKKIFNKEVVEIEIEEQKILLTAEDVVVEREVLEGLVAACVDGITIVLDTEITQELRQEGIAREIINKINTLRKQEGFEITDRINLEIEAPLEIEEACKAYYPYISGEVLAKSLLFQPLKEGKEIDINDQLIKLQISKAVQV